MESNNCGMNDDLSRYFFLTFSKFGFSGLLGVGWGVKGPKDGPE